MHPPDFSNLSLLVVGDLMLDRYWSGPTHRISPEAPVPVVRIERQEERPGGGANVALNLAALGAQVGVIGLAGTDATGDRLEQLLTEQGIHSQLLRTPDCPTISKLRVLSHHQQLMRLDFEQPLTAGHPVQNELVATVERQLASAQDFLILSDYAKGALAQAQQLVSLARARGIPVAIDPKGRDYERYRGATLITPNRNEFEQVVGPCQDLASLRERGEKLRATLELEMLLITLGEEGMLLIEAGQPPRHLSTQAREVYDVTGAGDTVIAVMCLGLAAGLGGYAAAELANRAAGLVVAKLGAGTLNPQELADAAPGSARGGVMEQPQLLEAVALARAAGEIIVMTNGCFDILHAGHLHYLRQARALGDRLIVAVNDDASVRALKGAERPINPLDDRMALLAALDAVDWVIPFSTPTPQELICAISPHYLVKGGDYHPDQIAGADCVRAAGGQVVVLPLLAGRSSSAILDRARTARQP